MDNLDFSTDDDLLAFGNNFPNGRAHTFPSYSSYTPAANWAFTAEELEALNEEMRQKFHREGLPQAYAADSIRQNNNAPNTTPLNTASLGLAFTRNMSDPADLLQPAWQFSYNQAPARGQYSSETTPDNSYDGTYNAPLQSTPVEYMPVSSTATQMPMHVSTAGLPMSQYLSMAGPMDSMHALAYPLNDYQPDMGTMPMDINMGLTLQTDNIGNRAVHETSGDVSPLEICSLSSSDNGWAAVNFHQARQSMDNYGGHPSNAVFNPGETLHIRSESNSSCDEPPMEQLSGSYEELGVFPLYSPSSEYGPPDYAGMQQQHIHGHVTPYHEYDHCAAQSPEDYSSSAVSPASAVGPQTSTKPVSVYSSENSTSPTIVQSPVRRRKSPPGPLPLAKITKVVTKKDAASIRKAAANDKRVGRRRGPLRPDQRQQAHEIRKLRACLRCKFLKKTCDKGDPCAGCRPSHARLWQVPCTRIDIKDIGFFLKDWKVDYERHVSVGFSVNNIKNFSSMERTLYITHGYGRFLPVNAREVHVIDEACFNVDWVESMSMLPFESATARLSAGMEGVSKTLLSEYIEGHLEDNFDGFVDEYFEGTPYLTEILHTAHKYYRRTHTPVIRKALKLVLAYALTQHITLVTGLSDEESDVGRIDDETSRFAGEVVAPVMINFQVKCALADMWRELQKDVLEELSAMYSSVYQGDKLRHWPTIFMIASVLLGIWEMMQFDCHYRELDEKKVDKFCNDMENTPVGVIIGLFQAISQKLPNLIEWDTSQHGSVLSNNEPICDALTEVRDHIVKNGE